VRRLKVAGQNGFLIDAIIAEKPICGLGVGPILASEAYGLTYGAAHL